jgi:DNA-binding transcriptional regulator YiaG
MKEKVNAIEIICPNCESFQVKTKHTLDNFTYGVGEKAVQLQAWIPVRICSDCEFEYTDFVAEDLRHEAVCRHLGVMTPTEILSIRKNHHLTRAEFAELSQIGTASLARWETGELIQNASNDNYLYLLGFADNLRRLDIRRGQHRILLVSRQHQSYEMAKFKCIGVDQVERKRQEAKEFNL